MVFTYDKVLNFEGETGPYVQYTNARCLSVLNKVGRYDGSEADYSAIDDDESAYIITLLEKFTDVLRDVVSKNEPCILARYLVDLAQSYNKFYLVDKIAGEPVPVMTARAMLTEATHIVIEEGLRLLGIAAPKRM